MDNLSRRITAVASVLKTLKDTDSASWLSASKKQSECIAACMDQATVSADDSEDLVQKLTSAPWNPKDLVMLIEHVSNHMDMPTRRVKKQNTTQNFTKLLNYLPKSLWEKWSDKSPDGPDGFGEVAALAYALGLRFPSEPTAGMMTAANLLLSEGKNATLSTHPSCLNVSHKSMKKTLKKCGDVSTWIETLPATPSEFRNMWPDIYAEAYKGFADAPIPNPIEGNVQQVLKIPFMREPKAGVFSAVQRQVPTLDLGNLSGGSSSNSFAQLAQGIVQGIQSMQQQQQQFMEGFMQQQQLQLGPPRLQLTNQPSAGGSHGLRMLTDLDGPPLEAARQKLRGGPLDSPPSDLKRRRVEAGAAEEHSPILEERVDCEPPPAIVANQKRSASAAALAIVDCMRSKADEAKKKKEVHVKLKHDTRVAVAEAKAVTKAASKTAGKPKVVEAKASAKPKAAAKAVSKHKGASISVEHSRDQVLLRTADGKSRALKFKDFGEGEREAYAVATQWLKREEKTPKGVAGFPKPK